MSKDNIILIGFMGSGKSTIGKKLSLRTGLRLIDTDDYIEKKQGMSINRIFELRGEQAFRDMETGLLEELSADGEPAILSTGGGLPVRECNQELLRELGHIYYLEAGIDTLVKRLKNDSTRPLLKGDDLRKKIETLMEAREDIYKSVATTVIDTEGLGADEICERICQYENSCD